MKITQDVREYAAQKGLEDQAALDAGMRDKAEEFKKTGGKLYHELGSDGAAGADPGYRTAAKE
jgi:hypothetical protein